MRKEFLQVCLLIGTMSLAAAATGQEVVHALGGKVTAIYPATNTIKVLTDDGSEGLFQVLTKPGAALNFQKSVKALTVPAGSFTAKNDQVVVFFFGDDAIRTAVALEDLGAAPLHKSLGTVVDMDKHAHLLTIKNSAGVQETFHIDAKTVADTTSGVVPGEKFETDKGVKVRVTASVVNGSATALLIRELSL